jgi:hypothetical protein
MQLHAGRTVLLSDEVCGGLAGEVEGLFWVTAAVSGKIGEPLFLESPP